MKQKVILIVSVLVGIIAFILTNKYLRDLKADLYRGAAKIPIIVANRDLPGGTTLELKDLAKKDEFASAVGENIFGPKDLDNIIGKRLKYPLDKGDPVWWSHVDLPERSRSGLAPMIQIGLRGVSVAISGAAGVSGLVRPNDRVDILGTFSFPSRTNPEQMESVTLTLLQDVTVLATGQRLARDDIGQGYDRRSGAYSTVTFELTPREAELLVFAQHVKGQLALSLRNPEDISFEDSLPSVNFDHIETKLEEYNLYRQREIRLKREL